MKTYLECLVVVVGGIAIVIVLACAMALPTMLLWNVLIPDVTNGMVTPITFWQALGMNFLCAILFKQSVGAKKD